MTTVLDIHLNRIRSLERENRSLADALNVERAMVAKLLEQGREDASAISNLRDMVRALQAEIAEGASV